MVEVNYELYTQVKGRWNLEARFGSTEREDALNEAQRLAQDSQIEAVRVVRETYDPELGAARETTIFSTVKRGERSRNDSPGSGDDDDGYDDYDDDDGYDDYDDDDGYDDYDDDDGYDDYDDDDGYDDYDDDDGYDDYDDDDDYDDESKSEGRRRSGKRLGSISIVILIKIVLISLLSFGFAIFTTHMHSVYFLSN